MIMSLPSHRLVHSTVPMAAVKVWRVVLTVLPLIVLIVEAAVVVHGVPARLVHDVIFGRVLLAELWSAHLRCLLMFPLSSCCIPVVLSLFPFAFLGLLSGGFLAPLAQHRELLHVVRVLLGSLEIPLCDAMMIMV
jgi:hypothetical protein